VTDELIINLAPTGMVPTRADSPHVPLTPEAVAADVRRCADLGGRDRPLHPRDADGLPSQDPAVAATFIRAVRDVVPDVVICATTSGRLDPELGGRAAVLDLDGEVRPEMASLTLGSLNFPKQASVNAPATIQGLATRMRDRGIVPEWEVFDLGMLDYATYLRTKGCWATRCTSTCCSAHSGRCQATPFNLALAVERLPAGATWAAAGIGRHQFAINRLAIAMGGHVRVGLEDNLWWDDDRTELATNPRLVERLVTIARAMGREPASPALVRDRLGIVRPILV
jgi:uncharacterized protein (DUF849 family)